MSVRQQLRPHQVEAVDAVVRALGRPDGRKGAAGGLRAQVIAATGSGKSLIGVRAAQRLHAGRVLVLVPTLALLGQMVEAWRGGDRGGQMFGVCGRREGADLGLHCSTDPGELAGWLGDTGRCTVFATYAAVGMGVLDRAHTAGVGRWDLVVVDEAHRTSGALGKPWAAVHDDGRIPALRRLYMTATPRLWDVSPAEDGGGGRVPERLVASMDDEAVFGPVVYRLTMSQAIEQGLIAQYQVVCVDIADPQTGSVQLVGGQARTDAVRGARLAALQTAVLKTGAEHRLRRMLSFHHRTSEAEAFAGGLQGVAKALWEDDPAAYPEPELVWSEWLCGRHKPAHRRQVLEEFASGVVADQVMERCVLSSAKVLGEGVDTKDCDAVVFADVRGSAPDVVQAVGRALRMRPGEGKTASLVVPVFLGAGEEPDEMLVSTAYDDLAKVLTALRAHDAEAVEQLAAPQAAGRPSPVGGGAVSETGVSAPAQGLLSFSTPRDPVALAAFVTSRVLKPEGAYWRRGCQAALAYHSDQGHLRVPLGHTTPDGFPLGAWIARQRHAHRRGDLGDERVQQLDELGMIWSHHSVAFEEGLAAARAWADAHGHLLAPTDATWQDYPVGIWLKNQRAAARHTHHTDSEEQPADTGSSAGGLGKERRQALEDIDPAWCPAWPIAWQRCFHLARTHLERKLGPLPRQAGQLIIQGEDLGQWVSAQHAGWHALAPAQQWLLTSALGVAPHGVPAPVSRVAAPRRSRAQMWAANVAAARQYAHREGHLSPPRAHIETVDGSDHPLGVFIANARARRTTLAPERLEELTTLGMRWN